MAARLPNLARFKDADLLRLWSAVMRELIDREVIRTSNNPVGDICEGVVAAHYGVRPEPNSKAGYDLITNKGVRVQVKGRRTTRTSRPAHYSPVDNLPDKPFDIFVAVHLDEDFQVTDVWQVPWEVVNEVSRYIAHVNAWRMPYIRGNLITHPGIKPLRLRV